MTIEFFNWKETGFIAVISAFRLNVFDISFEVSGMKHLRLTVLIVSYAFSTLSLDSRRVL